MLPDNPCLLAKQDIGFRPIQHRLPIGSDSHSEVIDARQNANDTTRSQIALIDNVGNVFLHGPPRIEVPCPHNCIARIAVRDEKTIWLAGEFSLIIGDWYLTPSKARNVQKPCAGGRVLSGEAFLMNLERQSSHVGDAAPCEYGATCQLSSLSSGQTSRSRLHQSCRPKAATLLGLPRRQGPKSCRPPESSKQLLPKC
jgi:hypothetical protein